MRLEMEGIKGGSRALTLDRLNLLTGPNGSGKTAIPQGLKVFALGYDPAIGKRPMDQAAIMDGEAMIVRLFLEDEAKRAAKRVIRSGEKGHEMEALASWLPDSAKPGEHASAISGLFGRDADEIAQCLDISQLLKLSPNKRAAALEELLGEGDKDAVSVAKAVIHHALIRLVEIPEAKAPEGNSKLMAMVADGQRVTLRTAGNELVAKVETHGLGGAMSWARAEKLSEDRTLKQKVAAEKALREKLHALAETQPEEIDRCSRELKELEAEITAEETKREARSGRAEKAATAKDDVSRFFRLGLDCNADFAGLQEKFGDVEEKKASLDAIVRSLDAVPSPKPTDLKEISQVRKAAEAARKAAEAVPNVELPSVEEEERLVRVSAQELETAEADPWRRVHTKSGAILAGLRSLGDEKGQGIKTMATAAADIHKISQEKMGEDPDVLLSRVDKANVDLRWAIKGREANENGRADAEARRKKLTAEAATLDEKADQMLADTERASAEAKAMFDETAAQLRKERDALKSEIEEYDAAAQTIRDTSQEWKEKHEEAQGRLAGLQAGVDKTDVDLDALREKRDALADEKAGLEAAGGKRAAVAELVEEIAVAKAASEVYTALHEGAKRVRQAGVTEASSGLTTLMGDMLKAGGRSEKPYIRALKSKCEIGWRTTEGQEIPIQALSGGEWALFASALSAGVIILRGAEIKILIVEAGEADSDTLYAILRGIENVAENLTAALVLTHIPIVFEPEGWTQHEFEREEVAA